MAAAYTYRISVEEAALVAALGEPYKEYMRRTRRLVPFLFQMGLHRDAVHHDDVSGLSQIVNDRLRSAGRTNQLLYRLLRS
jgi:hypothetical protein